MVGQQPLKLCILVRIQVPQSAILDMQKLEPHKHIPITREILAPILRTYGITDFTFEPINEGIENTSVCVETIDQKYVLRIYSLGRKSDEDITFELTFQDYLREKGVPIPKIFQNVEGDELTITYAGELRWQVLLMEFVEGQSVTTRPSHDLIAELAAHQARMHLMGIEFAIRSDRPKQFWNDLRDSLAERIDVSAIEDRATLDLIDRIKNYMFLLPVGLPYGYNHLDIDFDGNVITKDGKVAAIVDFDDVQYSPLAVCLGYTLWCLLDDEGEDAMWTYLRAYEQIRPLSNVEREILPHVVFFRNYVLAAMRLLLKRNAIDIQKSLSLEKAIPNMFSRTWI